MAQNFLYMFEFVVDDLLVTRPNVCAPEEYPTCCEISFRSSVFVSICDREFGTCVDVTAPKCGKCCLFSLESPVSDKDRLLIHIYKKKTEKCKFLVGATDLPIKPLFDKVTESFNIENPNWMEQLARHTTRLPDPKEPSKTTVVDNDCDDEEEAIARREQMCPTSELTKRLLPLFNMKGMQTGNLVLIMRLVCTGPAIVSTFPFSKICSTPCPKKKKSCTSFSVPESPTQGCGTTGSSMQQGYGMSHDMCGIGIPQGCAIPGGQAGQVGPCIMPDPCKKPEPKKFLCRRYFACNVDKSCPFDECEDDCDRECPTGCKKPKKSVRQCPSCRSAPSPSCCSQPEPCKKPRCTPFFGPNSEKSCPCEECADECEAGEECSEETSEQCMQPCFINPTRPEPGPEAYEEFEACLNGSGLVIRVLKDTHQVESVTDGTENVDLSDNDCEKVQKEPPPNPQCESLSELLQRSNFARNHIKRRTQGHIINHPRLPPIRANIKYSGNEACCPDSYHLPFCKIRQACETTQERVDQYRRRCAGGCGDDCEPIVPPQPPQDIRNCCLQVDPQDIKNALKGINVDTRKKGIEVCYKTCDDTDSDVFLVKLGSKQRCQRKKNAIEIELKTPKQPSVLPIQKITTETQINEAELDAALSNTCKKKKGKKGKKGKKK